MRQDSSSDTAARGKRIGGRDSRESKDNRKHNLHTNRQTETELKWNEMKRIETNRNVAQHNKYNRIPHWTDEVFSVLLRATVKSEQKLWQWDRNSNPRQGGTRANPLQLDIMRDKGEGKRALQLVSLLFFSNFFSLAGFFFCCESNVNREYISFSCRLTHPPQPDTPLPTHAWPFPLLVLPPALYSLSRPALLLSQCLFADLTLFPALPTHFFYAIAFLCGV